MIVLRWIAFIPVFFVLLTLVHLGSAFLVASAAGWLAILLHVLVGGFSGLAGFIPVRVAPHRRTAFGLLVVLLVVNEWLALTSDELVTGADEGVRSTMVTCRLILGFFIVVGGYQAAFSADYEAERRESKRSSRSGLDAIPPAGTQWDNDVKIKFVLVNDLLNKIVAYVEDCEGEHGVVVDDRFDDLEIELMTARFAAGVEDLRSLIGVKPGASEVIEKLDEAVEMIGAMQKLKDLQEAALLKEKISILEETVYYQSKLLEAKVHDQTLREKHKATLLDLEGKQKELARFMEEKELKSREGVW